jgi:hypothetical protein
VSISRFWFLLHRIKVSSNENIGSWRYTEIFYKLKKSKFEGQILLF